VKFGSLFSGVGGFDLGFERSGMECKWQVEYDPHCQAVLERHYPNVKRYKDVRNVGSETLEAVDLICGGFPCQDLSIAGKRAGFAGERSGLWYEYQRIIDEMRPQWVVIENVPGLLSSAKGQDFETIIRALDEFGYGVAWRVLDSQYFGVPQRRMRVFIVASLGNMRCGQVLFESESMSGDFTPSKQEREAVTSTFTVRTGTHGSGGRGYLALKDGAMTLGGQPQWVAKTIGCLDSQCGGQKLSGQTAMNGHLLPTWWNGGDISASLNTRMNDQFMPDKANFHAVPAPHVWQFKGQDSSYRPQTDTMPTVTSTWGTGGNNMPFVGVRRLTPTECERLQGFPDGWTDSQSDTQRYKQMGNAVTVNVIEWLGKRINR
jgi:DNA (cytosine-5)-methyltransferase 1